MSLLIFVGALAFLILIHELGHYLAAKLVGIPIQEFGIGFPPKILTLFKANGTEFTLNWLPLGGFVRPQELDNEETPDALLAAKPIKRIIVLLAGSLMNFLTAIIILSGVYYLVSNDLDYVAITGVSPDSPAEAAGIQSEDYIVEFNGIEVTDIEQLQNLTNANKGKEVEVLLLRDGEEINIRIIPRIDHPQDEGSMGIGLFESLTLPQAIAFSFQDIGFQVQQITSTSIRLIGLKGIFDGFQMTRDVDATQDTFFSGYYSIMFVASLSFSLAILNMLPVPFFDGGKILLALPELLFKVRVPMNIYYALNVISLGLVLILMVYVNVQDFVNPAITLTPAP